MELPVNYNELTPARRRAVREEYIRIQEGLCCYCKAPLDGEPAEEVAGKKVTASLYPDGFFKWSVHLHHSHKTGMTIGVVHNHCNAVLWEYEGE